MTNSVLGYVLQLYNAKYVGGALKWSCNTYDDSTALVSMNWYLRTMRDAYCSCVPDRHSNDACRGVWSQLPLPRPVERAARPSMRPIVARHVAGRDFFTYDTKVKQST